ncbi:MAG: O-antigen ligase family protein [Sedimentisphaerales bacterium]|nr:O-antigen ligase family protein [Sedimentisphaerales bacterium]
MRQEQANICFDKFSVCKFDTIIEWLLISLLAFMPFAFGAVEAWSEEIVVILAAAITICFLLKLIFEKQTHFFWSWSYVPVVLFIIAAIFQIIPIPAGIISVISSNTAAIKKELLSDLPDAKIFLRYMTLSFYPNATKHDLRLVISIAAVFLVVANIYRQPVQIKRLLSVIAIIGGLIALLTLAQDLFGNGRMYWKIPTGFNEAFSGTFVNHSHYGQFMNLSIGAALGLIFVGIHESFQRKKVTAEAIYDYLSSNSAKSMWFLLVMITIGAATVFVSLTRGGMVSMFIAAVCTTLALSSRHNMKSGGWIIVLISLFAFVCVLYIGFDAVYDRLSSLRNLHEAQAGRWQILKDISLAWTRFPFFGTGLGTHEVVYPMFDRSTIAALAAYAENEYAQAAEETGLIGLVSLLTFGILIFIYYFRNIRSSSVPVHSAAFGLGFGLLAILIHSLSDFGQHLPANAFLSAIFCALLLALTRIERQDSSKRSADVFPKSRSLYIVILLCVSALFGWIILSADNARIAETHWKKALAIEKNMIEKNWQASDTQYAALIKNTATAADYQPENVKYKHWLNIYRWESICNTIDPNTGQINIPEPALKFVHRIVDELHNARKLCSTYGATYCIVGQLERFILNDPNGTEYIRKGFKLAPCDPVACFVTAFLDVKEQNIDASFVKFSRTIELDGSLFPSVADIYINDANRPDLAIVLAKNNSEWLSYVANAITDTQKHADIIKQAQEQIVQLLIERCSGPDVSASALASLANIFKKERDNEKAIENYNRALSLEYSQVQWRYALAQLYADTNRISEAIHEARICLRFSPQFEAAERLIEELSVKMDSIDDQSLIP